MWFEYFINAFVVYPVFMIVITVSGLIAAVQIARIALGRRTQKDKSLILGAGLFALFVGLLVFPIESFQMLEAIKAAGGQSPTIAMGGFYISFVPMFYGLFWFLVSLVGWLKYKKSS